MTSETEQQVTFASLVMSLATTAAVHFGDLVDPNTGRPSEPNLEGARQMIEILGILQVKTKGNLDPDETTILERVLYELRLRFVEVQREGGGSRIIMP
jgi:hypothetical protein